MRAENFWSDRAKAPDPDDLSSEHVPVSTGATSVFTGKRHVDYTHPDHHQEIPDSRDSGDPSRPQGEFWHQNERPGADAIDDLWPSRAQAEHASESPLKPTPQAQHGEGERPTIFFVDLRHKL